METLSEDIVELLVQLKKREAPFDGETSVNPGSAEDKLIEEALYYGLIQRQPSDGPRWEREFALTEKGERNLRDRGL